MIVQRLRLIPWPRLLDALKAPVPLRIGEAFAVVIYCIAPHVDDKRRSKWARALRYAAASKPSDERMFWSTSVKAGLGPSACPVGAYTISAEPWRPAFGT